MKTTLPGFRLACFCPTLASLLLVPTSALPAAESEEIVAVYSRVSPDYRRARLLDGTFQPETYAFGEGGVAEGDVGDPGFEKMKFRDVAAVMAPALASQNYRPCDPRAPRLTDLLILVYWGTTIGTDRTAQGSEYALAQALLPPPRANLSPPPDGTGGTAMVSDPSASGRAGEAAVVAAQKAADDSALAQSTMIAQIANRQRDRQNAKNAAVLGYSAELQRVAAYRNSSLRLRWDDIVGEVEESRYYVVLIACDFQELLRHKRRQVRWETRFSIRTRHHDFSEQLAAMAQSASRFFGQDSGGLARQPAPGVRVELGELKSLGPTR